MFVLNQQESKLNVRQWRILNDMCVTLLSLAKCIGADGYIASYQSALGLKQQTPAWEADQTSEAPPGAPSIKSSLQCGDGLQLGLP